MPGSPAREAAHRTSAEAVQSADAGQPWAGIFAPTNVTSLLWSLRRRGISCSSLRARFMRIPTMESVQSCVNPWSMLSRGDGNDYRVWVYRT